MLVVHATFPIDPHDREEALDLIEDLVEQSRAEDGMIEYHATIDLTDRNLVRFVERYEDKAAFEAHTETDHFREFEAAVGDWLAGEPDVVWFDVDSATELEL